MKQILVILMMLLGLSSRGSDLAAEPGSVSIGDDYLFRLQYVPKVPSALREQQEAERALASRGPFQYEGIRARAIQEVIFKQDLEEFAPLIRRLESESRRFELTGSELVLALSLSRILSEQTRAYGYYPWIREERVRFARHQLQDSAMAFPAITGQFYFAAQQFLNRHGLRVNLKAVTEILQARFQVSSLVKLQVQGQTLNLDLKKKPELFDGRFEPGQFMISFWVFQQIAHFMIHRVSSENQEEVFREILSQLKIEAQFDRRFFQSDFEVNLQAIPIEWNFSSAEVQSPQADLEQIMIFASNLFDLADQVEFQKKIHNLSADQVTYLIDQIFSRLGVSLSLGELDLMLEILFQKNPQAFSGIEDIEFFKPVEDLGLSLSLFKYLGGLRSKSTSPKDLGKIIGYESELEKMNERLVALYQSGEGVEIDWSFSSVRSQAYVPLANQEAHQWQISQSNENRTPFLNVVGALDALEKSLLRRWQRLGLKDVELPYHYLEYNRQFTVDFNLYDYRSRTFELAKKLRASNVDSRMPLDWSPLEIKFNERNLPSSEEALRSELYAQLNRIYISKIQTKVLRLWGYDFDSRFRSDMRNVSASFHQDVKPLYEKTKEDRFRHLRVGFSVLSVEVPADVSMATAHDYFWNLFANTIEPMVLREAAKVFQSSRRNEGVEAARAVMRKELEDRIRSEALKELGELLTETLQSESGPKLRHLPAVSGSRADVLVQFQNFFGKGNEAVAAEGVLLGYQNSVRAGSLLTFPIYLPPPSVSEAKEKRGDKKELFIVLVRSYEEGDLKDLYEVQNRLKDELELEQALEGLSGLVQRILIPSIGDLRAPQAFLGLGDSDLHSRDLVRDFVSRRIGPDNVEKIIRLAAEIENYQLNQEQAWDHTRWIPRHVKTRSTINSLQKGVGVR